MVVETVRAANYVRLGRLLTRVFGKQAPKTAKGLLTREVTNRWPRSLSDVLGKDTGCNNNSDDNYIITTTVDWTENDLWVMHYLH